jgi:hypothetical protein
MMMVKKNIDYVENEQEFVINQYILRMTIEKLEVNYCVLVYDRDHSYDQLIEFGSGRLEQMMMEVYLHIVLQVVLTETARHSYIKMKHEIQLVLFVS